MGFYELKEKRDSLTEKEGCDSITAQVYSVFLRQPNQIGSCASMCEPIDLSDKVHREIFLSSVRHDVLSLKSKYGFEDHDLFDKAFKEACIILFA
jgi:hypothetical protein